MIECTAGTTVTVSVADGSTAGTTAEYVQQGAGQIQVVAAGSMTVRNESGFNPYTRAQWTSVVVTIESDTTKAFVRGALDPV